MEHWLPTYFSKIESPFIDPQPVVDPKWYLGDKIIELPAYTTYFSRREVFVVKSLHLLISTKEIIYVIERVYFFFYFNNDKLRTSSSKISRHH